MEQIRAFLKTKMNITPTNITRFETTLRSCIGKRDNKAELMGTMADKVELAIECHDNDHFVDFIENEFEELMPYL